MFTERKNQAAGTTLQFELQSELWPSFDVLSRQWFKSFSFV
ncbi:hypothetical protein LINPERPRIM_LOCUS30737 [Linum perenne]